MSKLKLVLIAITATITLTTVAAFANDGPDLVTPFLKPIFDLTWQGQFNVDFASYLILSGIWMAWRSGYTRNGLILGLCGPLLGILFFAPYLLHLIRTSNGDPRRLLLGVHA